MMDEPKGMTKQELIFWHWQKSAALTREACELERLSSAHARRADELNEEMIAERVNRAFEREGR